MKKLILSLTVAAFALATAAQAGDPQECPFAKAAADKKACCADQAKTAGDKKACASEQANAGCPALAKKSCCASAAKVKTVKKAVSPKGAELARK
jgi:hypothetical protein